eukprot:jgi/Mesen1/9944/ME000705S09078
MASVCYQVAGAAIHFTSASVPAQGSAGRHSSSVFCKRSFKAHASISSSNALSNAFLGTGFSSNTQCRSQVTRYQRSTTGVRAAAGGKKVLIVNTNSGGHAVIGFWLAKQLQGSGNSVTILTVGEESSEKMKKQPFSRFSELRDLGVTTVWGSPADLAPALGGATFDVVLDNNGKDLEAVQPVADWAKANGASQFLFISSAGIYKTTDEPPHVEGDAVKEDAGHVVVEKYLAEAFAGQWASFRPQYITGDGNNKDCEEWFFDRIVRDRPVPIPGSGLQTTVIAHVADMASMIALAVEKPDAANGHIFNCVTDRAVTFDGLVRMCARAAGREAQIVHYDPKEAAVDAKKAFPFRNQHFYSEPRAAKTLLGWESKTDFQEALNSRFQDYLASGRDKKDIKFELDDKILAAVSQPVAA